MYKISKLAAVFSLALTALAMGGCALLGEDVAEGVASGVDAYCDETYSQRLVYWESINNALVEDGHEIHVICAGDPEAEAD